MARSQAQLEVNSFIKGLVTEASPLTFPDNASLDEDNFVLNRDGSRQRRLGMDYEDGYASVASNVNASSSTSLQTFNWKNAGGDPENDLIVVQIGNVLSFFDNTLGVVSTQRIPVVSGINTYEYEIGTSLQLNLSFASVDGILVVASGQADIYLFEYDGTEITASTERLKIRDLFGLEDIDPDTGEDLNDARNVTIRPLRNSITNNHKYNVDNQGWGVIRNVRTYDSTQYLDTLPAFGFNYAQVDAGVSVSERTVPSNADTIHVGMKFSPESTPRNTFYGDELLNTTPYNVRAAKGSFIIDALERGTSRLEAYNENFDRLFGSTSVAAPWGKIGSGAFNLDKTPGGAKVVSEYAGHVFYAGFSGEVTDGDNQSPKLSSYVLFSQLVKNTRDVTQCYQAGDPTSDTENSIVATDGGFIKIQEAYGINKLVDIGAGLIVLASNGVWMIRGESGIGFTATAHEVIKLSEHGCASSGSVVVADNTLFYWGDDGIYNVAPDEFGNFKAQNITATTIQSYYDDIPSQEKDTVKGFYDSYQRTVRWVYNNKVDSTLDVKELVLDVNLGAFYPATIQRISNGYPFFTAPFETPPYKVNTVTDEVVVEGDPVEVLGDQVTTELSEKLSISREIKYLAIIGETSDKLNYTFSAYTDTTFTDWVSYDSTGVDAEAYLITGYVTGGEAMRYKQAPALVTHLKRTETGFSDVGGDLIADNQSSCKVQAQWEWSNSAASNRWGKEFQTYQYKRHYFPTDVNDTFDTGFSTIVTRRKLRGKGRALSLKFSTESGKDLQLIGWGLELYINNKG